MCTFGIHSCSHTVILPKHGSNGLNVKSNIYIHRTHSQVITAHHTSSLAIMEGAFMIIIGVMAIPMTVEITVMKKDVVCDTRWEETLCFIHIFIYLQDCDIKTVKYFKAKVYFSRGNTKFFPLRY